VPCGYRGLPRLSAGALDRRPRGCRYDATIVADATLPPIRLGDLHGCDTQEKSEGTNKSGPSTLAHGTPRCACVRAAKITHSAQGRLETRTRSEINGIARLTHWFADATNGIDEMFARVFRAKDALCINDTCVNEDQLKSLLGQSAAAGASAGGGPSAPGGSSASLGESADTATTTTPASEEEEADAPEGPSEAPATPAAEETTTDAGAPITEPGGETRAEITPAEQPANGNEVPEPVPSAGTE
jgi:hypothetical protein